MDRRTLQRIEYDKVIEMLVSCATFTPGKELAAGLLPATDLAVVAKRQQETSEAKEILRKEPDVPLGGLKDIRKVLHKVGLGAVLEPHELLEVTDVLRAARRIKRFFLDKQGQYPLTEEMSGSLTAYHEIEDKVIQAIDTGGEIADRASAELRSLRVRSRDLHAGIKAKLDQIVRSPEHQKHLQEFIVTQRGDRYVVPVKQEYRGQFPGIVHDQSASGATLFIEPMAVVEMNNELRRLAAAEKQEILRILTGLTDHVRAATDGITANLEILARMDFVFARGRLSARMDAGEPRLNDRRCLDLKGARHPLIPGKAVPVSVHLGKEFHILVITGPNTGGKTVALKTVGLLTAMAQAGLHIPAETGSEIGIFRQLFTDIGDEQSIEQSLSTFSGHMTNIVRILSGVDPDSLVLMDELGSGTDPVEGAALAMAILEYLDERQVRTIATTHYSELKVFAFNRPGVENASVEFDTKTLQPTYRLLIGQPGSSSAFEIAARLGLNPAVIDRARSLLTKEDVEVAELIRELEEIRRLAEEERSAATRLRQQAEALQKEYNAALSSLQDKKARLLAEVNSEAAGILKKARMQADDAIREVREALAQADRGGLLHAQQARTRLRDGQSAFEDKMNAAAAEKYGRPPNRVAPGDTVFIPKFNQKGHVTAYGEDGQVTVQVGIMKVTVPIGEIRLDKEEKTVRETSTAARVMTGKVKDFNTEIDLRGLLVDEAIEQVEKYLDDAFLAGVPQVYLIHGKGTGALRKAIGSMLARHRHVKTYRLGQYGEGGMGVTVVELN
ncbi:MAG: endonuclease MutS2 [Bacillota bacterium]